MGKTNIFIPTKTTTWHLITSGKPPEDQYMFISTLDVYGSDYAVPFLIAG